MVVTESKQTTRQCLQCDSMVIWHRKTSGKIYPRYQQWLSLVYGIINVIFLFQFVCVFWFLTVINMFWFWNKSRKEKNNKKILLWQFCCCCCCCFRNCLEAISRQRELGRWQQATSVTVTSKLCWGHLQKVHQCTFHSMKHQGRVGASEGRPSGWH
jgi:hypothetical protein